MQAKPHYVYTVEGCVVYMSAQGFPVNEPRDIGRFRRKCVEMGLTPMKVINDITLYDVGMLMYPDEYLESDDNQVEKIA